MIFDFIGRILILTLVLILGILCLTFIVLKIVANYGKEKSNTGNLKENTGSQQLLRILKVKAKLFFKCACALLFLGLLVIFFSNQDIIALAIIPIVLGIGILLMGCYYMGGEKSLYVKRRPDILELADDLVHNTILKNHFFVISTKAIADKGDISLIVNRNYVVKVSGTTGYRRLRPQIVLVTNNRRRVGICGTANEKKMKELIITISSYCPNVAEKYLDGKRI